MSIRRCQSENCISRLKRREGDICDICKIKQINKERSISKLNPNNNMEEEKTDIPEERTDGTAAEPEITEEKPAEETSE